MSTRKSLHIGLNCVDPKEYGGWDGALSGCINDADAMKAMSGRIAELEQQIAELTGNERKEPASVQPLRRGKGQNPAAG